MESKILFVCFWPDGPQWARASSFAWFLDHTHDATQSVGLLWTSDQLVAETSTWQHKEHSQQGGIYAPGGIRIQSQQASGRRPP